LQQPSTADRRLEPTLGHIERQPAAVQPLFDPIEQTLAAEDNIRLIPPTLELRTTSRDITCPQYPLIFFISVPTKLLTFRIGLLRYRKSEVPVSHAGSQTTSQWKLMVTDNICYLEYAHLLSCNPFKNALFLVPLFYGTTWVTHCYTI
jgi:hypothetical protein